MTSSPPRGAKLPGRSDVYHHGCSGVPRERRSSQPDQELWRQGHLVPQQEDQLPGGGGRGWGEQAGQGEGKGVGGTTYSSWFSFCTHNSVRSANSAILLLLRCSFRWYPCLPNAAPSVFGRKPWTIRRFVPIPVFVITPHWKVLQS